MPVGGQPDQPRHQRGRCRTGQPLEVALVDDLDVGVETRQSQGGARHVDEGGQPPPFAHAGERPGIDDQRRRRAERDHVGQRVVLFAEGALAVGKPGHASIKAVEEHGQEDGNGSPLEFTVHGHDDGIEAGKQVAGGEGVGQQVDGSPMAYDRVGGVIHHACGLDVLFGRRQHVRRLHGHLDRREVSTQPDTPGIQGADLAPGGTGTLHCS